MNAGVRPPLAAGDPLAPGLEVVDHLSRNQALDVYDVWSHERQCRCVAKVLRPDRLDDTKARARLLREGELLVAIAHPHLVRAYELRPGREPVVVLEMLSGATLGHLLHAEGPLDDLDVAFLGLQLCSATGYLHAHGALHLDLKPDNIVAEAGRAKVLDLSLSRPPGRAHAGIGTRPYMAPEQATGGMLTEAADVWGIGAVLHKAASGTRPFAEHDGDERYPQIERRAPALRSRRPVARALAAAVDACLEPEPGQRPGLPELVQCLRAVLPAEAVAAWRGRLPGPGAIAAAA